MKNIPILILLMLCSLSSIAQDDSRFVCVTLASGIQKCGYLIADDGRELTLETKDLGKVILNKENILSIIDTTEEDFLNYNHSTGTNSRIHDPSRSVQPTRYFFAPSAHSLKKGEGYGYFSLLTGGNITYGVNDNFMAGFSASWLGAGLSIKQSFVSNENTKFAIGGMFLLPYVSGNAPTIFPFTGITKGDEANHLTINAGFLSQISEDVNSPMINISGSKKINSTISFISENYVFFNPSYFETHLVTSFGLRRYSVVKSRSTEFALIMQVRDDASLLILPWLSWTWPF